MIRKLFIAILSVIILASLIPVRPDTAAPGGKDPFPEPYQSVIRAACYDCHSMETRYPWYSYIAPVSFFIAHDVKEGREHLNFSRWDDYSEKKKEKLMNEMLEEMEEGHMPPAGYRWLHKDARITVQFMNQFREYIRSREKNSGSPAGGKEMGSPDEDAE